MGNGSSHAPRQVLFYFCFAFFQLIAPALMHHMFTCPHVKSHDLGTSSTSGVQPRLVFHSCIHQRSSNR